MRCLQLGLALVVVAAVKPAGVVVAQSAPSVVPPFEVHVKDDAGVAARAAWLVGGWPFARGVVRGVDSLRLLDESGKAVPVQLRPLTTWADGSLRWCQAVFPVDVGQGQTRNLRVTVDGSVVAAAAPGTVQITAQEQKVTVSTGPLELTFDRSDPSASGVKVGGMVVRWPATVLVMDGQEHRSDRVVPDELEVEESGPLSAQVRVSGWCVGPNGEKWVRALCRCRVFAGSSEVQLVHTVVWLDGPDLPKVAEIALEWPVPAGVTTAQVDDAAPVAPPVGLRPLGVAQPDGNRFAAEVYEFTTGAAKQEVKRPLGALAWTSGGVRTAVCTRHFWRQGPKGIAVDKDQVRFQFLAVGEQPLPVGKTRAKSHDLRLVFEPAASATPLVDLAKFWQTPPLPTVAPAYACATEALTVLSPVARDFWPEFEAAADGALKSFLDEAENDPQYWGLMNFGDTPMAKGGYGHKGVAYVDQEYDLGHTLYQLYVRSGDRRCFDWGLVAARHFMDVDVDQVKGHNRFHGYSENCESHQAIVTGLEWGHVMCDGLIDTYYLTGDRRALEKARGIGDVAAGLGKTADFADKRGVFQGAERNLGWPLLTIMRVYEATLDTKYRQAADNIVAYLNYYAANPLADMKNGTWWRSWMIGGCKVFMTGLLHEGLDKHHQLTGAEDSKRTILTSLDWMIDNMWRPDIETFMYEFNAYNAGHRDVWPTDLNLMVVHAFGYGYRISGDPKYLDVGLRALRSAIVCMPAASKHGKEFAMQFRTNLEMVGHLYQARGTFTWPGPRQATEAGPPGGPVQVVPPEQFPGLVTAGKPVVLPGAKPTSQSGHLEVRPRGNTLDGKLLTSWEEAGSWAEWEASVEQAGDYVLLLRYAAKDAAVRALAVDGQACGDLALSATGGWGEAPKEFRYTLAPDGVVARVWALAAGAHRVRLMQAKGGLALDFAALVPVAAGAKIPATPATRQHPVSEPMAAFPFDADDGGVKWQALDGAPPLKPAVVEGHVGKAIRPGKGAWAAVTVPSDFLATAGGVSVWFKPEWKLTNATVGQRAILHVMGEQPFRNALTICTIYGDIRVRLYDEKGHLCGTLEANAGAWEPGQWHQVSLTWDEDAMRLDLDGKSAARTDRVRLPQGPVGACYLGWRPGNWYLNAALDDLALSRGWLPE